MSCANWEPKSLQALTDRYNEEAKALAGFKGLMGRRGKVEEARRHIVAAAGWGLNPDEDATYFMYAGEHDPAKGYTATYAAIISAASVIVLSWVRPESRITLRKGIEALRDGAEQTVPVAMACCRRGL